MTEYTKFSIGRVSNQRAFNVLQGMLRDYFQGFFKTKAFTRNPLKTLWRGSVWVLADKLGIRSLTARGKRYSFTMRLPVSSESIGSRGFYVLRDYYEPVWEQLDKLIDEGDVVIDGGACQGVFSLAVSEVVGPLGRVIAVEPQNYAVDCLNTNIQLNDVSNIDIQLAALFHCNGEMEMFSQGKVYASLKDDLIRSPKQAYLEYQNQIVVPTVTIDSIAQKLGRHIDFIKYNINGAEVSSLKGAMRTIKRSKPTIAVVMFMTDYHDLHELCDVLMPCGYKPHIIHDETIRSIDLHEVPENNVIFIHNSKEKKIYDRFRVREAR